MANERQGHALLPARTFPDRLSPEDTARYMRLIYQDVGLAFARQQQDILGDPRFDDQRVAHSLRAMAHDITIVDTGNGVVGDALILFDQYNAGFASNANPGPGGVVPVVGQNPLLDGVNHTDTVAQTVSRGSLIVGNSTPKWDEKVIGGANTVLKTDGTDPSWGAIDHNYLSNRTRRVIFRPADFVQVNGTSMAFTFRGTYPNQYSGMQFIDNPAAKPQGVQTLWQVPKDWASGTLEFFILYRLILVGLGVDTIYTMRLRTLAYSAGSSPETAATTVTNDIAHVGEYANTHEVSIGTVTVSADQYVRIVVDRETVATDDTTDTVDVIAVAVEYTADM